MKCNFCTQEFDPLTSGYTYYCGRKCYDKHYYRLNKEKRTEYFRKRYKETYVLKPKPPKKSEEEKKAQRLAYYHAHKEYYKQKAHEYHLKHKNDPEYRRRHNEATKRYQKRRKLKDEYRRQS